MSNPNPIPEDEASEPEMILAEEEEDYGTLEESLISFRLSGPNERLSRNDQSDDEPGSSGDSTVLSLREEPRSQFTRK